MPFHRSPAKAGAAVGRLSALRRPPAPRGRAGAALAGFPRPARPRAPSAGRLQWPDERRAGAARRSYDVPKFKYVAQAAAALPAARRRRTVARLLARDPWLWRALAAQGGPPLPAVPRILALDPSEPQIGGAAPPSPALPPLSAVDARRLEVVQKSLLRSGIATPVDFARALLSKPEIDTRWFLLPLAEESVAANAHLIPGQVSIPLLFKYRARFKNRLLASPEFASRVAAHLKPSASGTFLRWMRRVGPGQGSDEGGIEADFAAEALQALLPAAANQRLLPLTDVCALASEAVKLYAGSGGSGSGCVGSDRRPAEPEYTPFAPLAKCSSLKTREASSSTAREIAVGWCNSLAVRLAEANANPSLLQELGKEEEGEMLDFVEEAVRAGASKKPREKLRVEALAPSGRLQITRREARRNAGEAGGATEERPLVNDAAGVDFLEVCRAARIFHRSAHSELLESFRRRMSDPHNPPGFQVLLDLMSALLPLSGENKMFRAFLLDVAKHLTLRPTGSGLPVAKELEVGKPDDQVAVMQLFTQITNGGDNFRRKLCDAAAEPR